MPTVKGHKTIGKKKEAWGKWQSATGKIYRREERYVEEVARGKAKHRVRQGKAKQSNASQRPKGIKYLVFES